MAKIFGNKVGAIVLETDKGLVQIYIKDGKSIVTLESSRNLVSYAKNFDMTSVISPFSSLLSSVLPNNLGLKVIGREFGKRDTIILEDNNEKLTLHNEGIKKGDKNVRFTTYNNIKVDNLFDEYGRNPNVFSGFCNYKIDGLGNIDDREADLLKTEFTPKYTLKELIDGNKKTKDALIKESATERFLTGIYKQYSKEHESELDDIQKIGFKKIKNLFSEVSDSLEAGKTDDMLDTLERAKTTITSRNASITNIFKYINDSRLEGNYTEEEVQKALGMIYIREKLHLFDKKSAVEEKFKGYEIDPKLEMILGEDIVRSYLKEERLNFEDLLPIQFVRARQKIMNISPEEETKIDGVLKRYVDLVESMNFNAENSEDKESSFKRDELGVIVRNYENYLEEGVLANLGMPSGDGFITMFRNSIKTELIRQKVKCDDVIVFSYEEQREDEEEIDAAKVSEYTYVIKGDDISVLKDNIKHPNMEVKDLKEKYEKYIDPQEVKKQSISKLANKTHFIFVPEGNGVTPIKQEYQVKNLINETIYMLKTCESESDIRRASYIDEIAANVGESTAAISNADIEDVIYNSPADKVLETIEKKVQDSGYTDVEILSSENLVETHKEDENILENEQELDDKSDEDVLE